jgi:low temperature requirement protein LtrA
MELFFDLVYVFAVTQLSEHLSAKLSATGTVQTLELFLAVWWAWNYTAWATNWIDPERPPVALLMLVLMGISLIMSAAIPDAFGNRGVVFAGAYVALQVLRSAFMVVALGGQKLGRNYAQLLAWSAISGVVWIVGAGFFDGVGRLLVWAGALALDLGAPVHGFRLPGVVGTPMESWPLAGGHLGERMQLMLMIALGESVLRVGATLSVKLAGITAAIALAVLVGFVAVVCLWVVYFLRHAEEGTRIVGRSEQSAARLARAGYAYAHAAMVAGVIVLAVAIRATIDDPTGSVPGAVAAVVLGGPALYLAGLAFFKQVLWQRPPWPVLGAIAVLVVLAALARVADRLALAAAATAVLLVLAVLTGVGAGGARR